MDCFFSFSFLYFAFSLLYFAIIYLGLYLWLSPQHLKSTCSQKEQIYMLGYDYYNKDSDPSPLPLTASILLCSGKFS